MINNNIFPTFNKTKKIIVDGSAISACSFCKKYILDKTKQCASFYEKIDIAQNKVYTCPYGLSIIVNNKNIFTSLIIKERINKKTIGNLKNERKMQSLFNENQLVSIINDINKNQNSFDIYRETMHDLRNIASYFNSVVDEYKNEHTDKDLSSCEKSFVSLYELINFRLDILNGKVDLTSIIEKEQKIHPLIVKLYHILKYKSRTKNVDVRISSSQSNSFLISKSLYLSLFILLENSIKYSKPSSYVNVLFEEDNNKTTIRIENLSDRIFDNPSQLLEKGFRGSNANRFGKPGSGLGLSMATELLNKTNAKLDIEINEKDSTTSIFIAKITLFNPVNI